MQPERSRAGGPTCTALVALLGAICLVGPGCSGSPTIDPYRSERTPLIVERGSLQGKVLLSGTLEASQSSDLKVPRTDSWQLSIRSLAEDGSQVKKGDILVEFDNTALIQKLNDLELAIVRADNDLASQAARASMEIADKELQVEKQRIEVAKASLDAEIPRSLVSRREWEEKRLVLERSSTALANAKDELQGARKGAALEYEVKKIDFHKAERQYERTTAQLDALVLKAPVDGVFVVADHPWFGRRFQIGDMVRPGFVAARVSDVGKMKVKAVLSDVDDGRIEVGQATECVLDAYPARVFPGTVTEVSEIARKPSEKSLRRFFDVSIELRELDEIMRPGMSVRVEVQAGTLADGLLAPRAGLILDDGEPRARLAGGETRVIAVERCTPRYCAIAKGLSAGDRLRYAEALR